VGELMNTGEWKLELSNEMDQEFEFMAIRKLEKYVDQMNSEEEEE
jgi:hypothetical protein